MPFINSVRGSFSALRKVGGAAAKNLASITGGTITTPGDGYRYHTFTTPGTFDATSVGAPFLVDYLVVAGGGGGGGELSDQYNGGGGGGGGVLQASGASFAASSFGVTTGEAGRYQTKPSTQIGENGTNSTLGPITAIGGGGGGVDPSGGATGGGPAGVRGDYGGQPGGSGGGAGNYSAGVNYTAGDGTPSQGYPGGAMPLAVSGTTYPAGGGGGAGGAGATGDGGFYGQGGLTVVWPGNGVRYGGGGGGGATDGALHTSAPGKDPGGSQNNPQGGGGYGFTGADGFTVSAWSARVGYLAPIGAGTQTVTAGTITAATRLPYAGMPGGSSLLFGLGMGGGGAGRIPFGTAPGGGEGCPGSPGSVIVRYPLAQ